MKPFSTLSAKILFWLFLNLSLVAAIFLIFFTVRFQKDFQGLLGKHAMDRMRTAARLVSHELDHSPRQEWEAILERHSKIHGVDLAVVTQKDRIGPSDDFSFPPEVVAETEKALAFDYRRAGRQFHRGRFERERRMEPEAGPDGHEPEGERPPRLMIRTKKPTVYWTGTFMPIRTKPFAPPEKAILLAASDSLSGNGFFFDPLPWIAAAGFVAVFSVLFWTPLIRHITKPLERMTRASEKIASGRFDVTIEEKRADEIGRLGRAINHMTSRLAGHVKGQKRFLGDVAHELGSPIARIQFGLGVLEQRCDEQNRQRVKDVLEDVAHMSGLVNELLSFSRAEISPEKVGRETMELLPIVREAKDRESLPDVEIRVQVPPGLTVCADGKLLTRAVANLLRNAVRYAGKDGPVMVQAWSEKHETVVQVSDSGPGVDEEVLDRLFEPFYRPEPSRNRKSGGAGLGLAIVKTCVDACQGSVAARNTQPKGFEVSIRLPLKSEAKKG